MLDNLPLPPPELQALSGNATHFDTVTHLDFMDAYGPLIWRSVLDFGCGPGRLARWLLTHDPLPHRYVGIDLDTRGLSWCAEHLYPIARSLGLAWDFVHHDVYHPAFNPTGTASVQPLPMPDTTVSLVLAHSVFTHLSESQTLQYLHEIGRVLTADGLAYMTVFLLDRDDWPMLAGSNALYISADDPGAAVIYDRDWLRETARAAGLRVVRVMPPGTRRYHWRVVFARQDSTLPEVEWPDLDAVAEG